MLEQTGLQTELPRVCGLRLQVVHRINGLALPLTVGLIPLIYRVGVPTWERNTNRSE